MIEATVVADSKNEFGNRITTLLVVMPRYILAEFNTHRMLSKNSASSRAIPFAKNLKNIEENPFIPIAWQKDHKGMQGTEYITRPDHLNVINQDWLQARDYAIMQAKRLAEGFGNEGDDCVTKQIVNRLLEPFMWHTVLVTGTEWENFFALRCPQYNNGGKTYRSRKDYDIEFKQENGELTGYSELEWLSINKGMADIHMMATAEAIWDAMNESTPKELRLGEWHIPFEEKINLPPTIPVDEGLTLEEGVIIRKLKVSTAFAARTSYTVVGDETKEPTIGKLIEIHDGLTKNGHWSCFEHCAQAYNPKYPKGGNFQGFIQYRKMFANENITK